jgi:hypothetical protein
MANIAERIQRVIEEMTGNEALLEMLETDAATEMLDWGKSLAATVVKSTEDMDDFAADLALLPRLKAVRQSIRSVGNWAAGKYSDPTDRLQLRDKLLQHFQTIFGDNANLPSAGQLDAVLNEVDNSDNTPLQLILKLKSLLSESI